MRLADVAQIELVFVFVVVGKNSERKNDEEKGHTQTHQSLLVPEGAILEPSGLGLRYHLMMERLQSLADNLTLDEVATLTDADIVRRRFDMSNVRWVGALSIVALFVAISQLIRALVADHVSAYQLPLAIVHVVVAFAAAAFFGELVY